MSNSNSSGGRGNFWGFIKLRRSVKFTECNLCRFPDLISITSNHLTAKRIPLSLFLFFFFLLVSPSLIPPRVCLFSTSLNRQPVRLSASSSPVWATLILIYLLLSLTRTLTNQRTTDDTQKQHTEPNSACAASIVTFVLPQTMTLEPCELLPKPRPKTETAAPKLTSPSVSSEETFILGQDHQSYLQQS